MEGKTVKRIKTDLDSITFYARHAVFDKGERRPGKVNAWRDNKWVMVDGFNSVTVWGISIEEKEYQNSNHRTKISYFGEGMITQHKVKTGKESWDYRWISRINRAKATEIEKTITNFVNTLMQGVKAEPRFSLAKMQTN